VQVSGRWLLDNGVEAVPGFEIDPEKSYWYDGSTGEARELLRGWRRYWAYMPWEQRKDRRRWQETNRINYAIVRWEFDHLPEAIWEEVGSALPETFGRCFAIVTGRHMVSEDMLYVEMAADSICAMLGDHPTAEEAFRRWFNHRYDY
jgi:hypothetical protein